MNTKYSKDERTTAQGSAVLFRRKDSKAWQARIKRYNGTWVDVSTKEQDFKKAKKVAADKYYYMKWLQENNQVDITKTFKSIAQQTIKEIEVDTHNDNGKEIYIDYKRAINKYLIPCFNNLAIHNINREKLLVLDKFRIEVMGKVPNFSTIATHNAALYRVFKTAIDKGYMLETLVPKLINNGKKPTPRPYFNKEDYRKVSANIRFYWESSHKQITKDIRYILWNYVLILANTGMRCGKESLNIKWHDLRLNSDGDIEIRVDGKTGDRTLIAQDVFENTTKPLERLRDMHSELKGMAFDKLFKRTEYIFSMANNEVPNSKVLSKAFTLFIKQQGIQKDSKGHNRTLYSLRHTYATEQLTKHKTDMHTLARQMGTSQKMLEDYYSKVDSTMHARQLSGRAEYESKLKKTTESEELLKAKLKIAELENKLLKVQLNQ